MITKNQVSKLFLTTSLFNLIIDQDPMLLAEVKQILTGGESHSVKHMQKAIELLKTTKIYNVYGPTESTTFASYYEVKSIPSNAQRIPIGKALAHTQLHLLNDNLKPVALGEQGEIYISGAGLAIGYLNQPQLTAERFLQDPEKKARILYKTGDLGVMLPSGDIDFIGRVDNQVKIRGFRIELGEIEAALLSHLGVEQAAVVMCLNKAGEKELVAFVKRKTAALSQAQLINFLNCKLPSYMLPGKLIWLEDFPMTLHNKIDRKELENSIWINHRRVKC